jgi:uncharacterized membrane protein YadS
MTQEQFGTWAGIAIHDVASVVGAGKAYGPVALDVGTAVKLSRVLYLIPITLLAAWLVNRSRMNLTKESPDAPRPTPYASFPYFILGFIVASVIRTYVSGIADHAPTIKMVASIGLAVALYLIGSGITRKTLKQVGFRPLLMGVALWAFISMAGFFAVRQI